VVEEDEEGAEAMEEEADCWLSGEGPWEIAIPPAEMVAVWLGETERAMARGLEGTLLGALMGSKVESLRSGTLAGPVTSYRD